MMVGFGGKLRTEAESAALLRQADERYKIHRCHSEGMMTLLEVFPAILRISNGGSSCLGLARSCDFY